MLLFILVPCYLEHKLLIHHWKVYEKQLPINNFGITIFQQKMSSSFEKAR